jgi:hypothetical protein
VAITPQQRSSVASLNLPFGRVVRPTGANLDTPMERVAAAGGYPGTWAAPEPGGGGLVSPRGRLSAMNLNLPLNRSFFPDGSNLNLAGERYLVGLSFRPSSVAPPLEDRIIAAISLSGPSFTTGTITRTARLVKVKPAPKVTGKTFTWNQVVEGAEKAAGGTAGPKPVAVYTFGSGRRRRIFTELQ